MVLSSSLRHFGELQLHDDRFAVLADVAVLIHNARAHAHRHSSADDNDPLELLAASLDVEAKGAAVGVAA